MDWESYPKLTVQFLRQEYGNLLATQTQPSQSTTLIIDLDNLPEDHSQLAHKCALLKRNCMASLFVKFFDLQPQMDPKSDGTRAVIHYRPEETIYIHALHDRVTVIFSTVFQDPDDMLIGKLFMQEFVESRRRLDRAPQVLYSYRTPPAELRGMNTVVSDQVAYITFGECAALLMHVHKYDHKEVHYLSDLQPHFMRILKPHYLFFILPFTVLGPRHITTGPIRQKTIDLIQMLRNYLHYHLKCSKAYIQMRMRAKTVEFLKVINRARVEITGTPVITVAPTGEISPLYAAALAAKSGNIAEATER
ncbi:actin related protein 2/3 complex, subunit 2 [Paragonimus westermani]|uniref:Arp2/3 complex 34 kDa subunit n=1 Tax=Paragonimus westermani TaxID=34504 RepID=A0A5J4NCM0_9TREM|nr:actin related protein 2/3 complex, subunit 2 [Paragonimus westermani]